MELPQAQLNDVKQNPFVIDIVNNVFISAGIRNIPGHHQNLVDNIQAYPMPVVPDTAIEITCRYQKIAGLSNVNSFSFSIYADVPIGYYLPETLINFVCGDDFYGYERLFMSGRLVAAPQIPNSNVTIANDYYYLWYVQNRVEVLRTRDASNPNRVLMDSVAGNGNISPVVLTAITRNQMRPIRLFDKLLFMIGFTAQSGNLFGLVDLDYFEGLLTGHHGYQMTIYLIKERTGYSLAVQDADAQYGCRLYRFFYMEELQELLWLHHHARISLNDQQLANISMFFNETELSSYIIRTLPQVVETFVSQSAQEPARQDIVDHVAQQYGISPMVANHYLMMGHIG
jgi:hypothetical protein